MAEPSPSVDNQPQQFLFGLETLTQRLYDYVDTLTSSKRKLYGFIWLAVAIVFVVVSSLPLPGFLFWLSPIIGLPAGIILFALILSFIRVTRVKNWRVVQVKEWAVQRKRITYVTVGAILFAVFLIFSSQWLPQGVGGALTIVVALSGYNIARRTPYEIELAAKGIPDPRDFEDNGMGWDEEPVSSDYINNDTDDNDDDHRGRRGLRRLI